MTEQTKRVFSYNGQTWEDPGAAYTNDDVRKHLSSYFPELANASVETADLADGRQEVKFVKRAGTKANDDPRLSPFARMFLSYLEFIGQDPTPAALLQEAEYRDSWARWFTDTVPREPDPEERCSSAAMAIQESNRAASLRAAVAILWPEVAA